MGNETGRIAPSGSFRVTGYDQYDYSDYWVGDFLTLESAIESARSKASVANATPSAFSDIFLVYDDAGVCRYRITYDELDVVTE